MSASFKSDSSGIDNLKKLRSAFIKDQKTVHSDAEKFVYDYQFRNVAFATGRLRDSIHIERSRRKKKVISRIQSFEEYAYETELNKPYARPSIRSAQKAKIINSYARRFNKIIKAHKI